MQVSETGPTANGVAQDSAAETGTAGPVLQVLAQYTKDVSFENPNAPESLRNGQEAPAINVNIEIRRQTFSDDTIEVVLMLKAVARRSDAIVFIAEVEYAGLFAIQNIPSDEMLPVIMVECPRLLFPFARQIIAEITQNGGYPPIMLEPPDFAAMFRDKLDTSIND
ncbi:MAG: protein-export chaperone SecB [Hyphomonadaceae bacterium]|nr:protein-export chaperone SecB [Hyphomonadaceae bacterium]